MKKATRKINLRTQKVSACERHLCRKQGSFDTHSHRSYLKHTALLGVGISVLLIFNLFCPLLVSAEVTPVAAETHFNQNSEPEFILKTRGLIKSKETKKGEGELDLGDSRIKVNVTRQGEPVAVVSEIETIPERGDQFKIKVQSNPQFYPGKYKLEIDLDTPLRDQTIEQDFSWGVLAINPDQSIYAPNQEALIGMAVLDDEGKMVPDAKVTLEIVDPKGSNQILSTENGTIKISPEINFKGLTKLPDYYTIYKVREIGRYQLRMRAETKNGVREIEDRFYVEKEPKFEVRREGPTRIYPPVPYNVKLNIKANQDSKGPVKEFVPKSFRITEKEGLKVTPKGPLKVLTWERGFKKGEEQVLEYQFKAPNISPQFYLLGPLEIGTSFEEKRSWQIAVDDIENNYCDDASVYTGITVDDYTLAHGVPDTVDASSSGWGTTAENWVFNMDNTSLSDFDSARIGITFWDNGGSLADDTYEVQYNVGSGWNTLETYNAGNPLPTARITEWNDAPLIITQGEANACQVRVYYTREKGADGVVLDVDGVTMELTYTQKVSGTSNSSGTVAIAINNILQLGKTDTISGGTWEITDLTLSADDIVTVWIDLAAPANESTGVTKKNGSTGSITGMVLDQHVLSIGSADDLSLTVANLGLYDNDQDDNIMHSANIGILNIDDDDAYTDEEIDILSGETLTISGTETLITHDLTINGTLTSGGNSTYSVSGSWDNNDTFTPSTSTVTFTASLGTETIDSAGGSGAFNTLNLGQALGTATWNLSSALDVDGVLTINYGTLGQGTNNITLANNLAINASGNFSSGSGTFTFDGDTGPYTWANSGSQDDLGAVSINGTNLTINLNSSVTATSVNVASSQILGLGSSTYILTLTGSGTAGSRPFIIGGSLTEGTDSTVKYTGTLDTDVEAETYDNLNLSPLGGSGPTYTLGTGDSQTINCDALTVGNGINSVTVTADANNPTLDVGGDFTISANGGFTAPSTGTFTVGGSWSNSASGIFTHSSGGVTFDATSTGKTIDSGGDAFNDIAFNSGTGGWLILTNNLTAANDFAVTDTAAVGFMVNGVTVEVQGTYSIADAETANTVWTSATLYLNSETAYTVGSRTQTAETYDTLQIGANTDIRIWNSSASVYTVDATGSLYSQDHANANGDLYIWGDYHTQANDYWSYATDFDGTDLTGVERQVDVLVDTSGSVTVDSGDVLAAIGTSSNRSTVNRQGASNGYDFTVNQGTINFQYTDFDYLDGNKGIDIQASSTVTSLDNCAFDNLVGTVATDDAFITVDTTVIGSGTKTISGVQIDNAGSGAEFNVNRSDAEDTGYWDFDSHTGTFAGEDYDGKNGSDEADPGMLKWDDSVANQPPNDPTGLIQKKTDETVLGVGDWTDETSVKFEATASDPDNPDTLYLQVEVKDINTAFDETGIETGSGVGYSGTPVTVTVTVSSLSDDTEFHWRARVRDEASDTSSWVAYGENSEGPPADRDFGTDTSAPTGGTVNDGTSGDQDWNDGSLTTLEANWSGFDASVSGLDKYDYAMRREPDDYYWDEGGSVWEASENWYDNGVSTSVQVNSMNLQTGVLYYASVKATDNATNTGTPVDSNGQQVLPTLSFSLSGNTVTFDDLNDTNSWTDTKTLTTTTSTNASSGYTASAYITQLLTSLPYPSETVDNFYGTWANPELWPGGTYGFGYTSNDPLVQGSNRFQGGTEYAAFSQTASGDVVCDHTDAVNGSTGAVSNEQFTVTYKVAVSETQVSSTYRTYAIYVVTANY